MNKFIMNSTFALSALIGASGFAAAAVPFSEATFASIAQSGEVAVVGFHSPTCASCKVQKPNLEAVLKEDEFKNVKGLLADFDDSAEFRQELSKPVRGPATIVVFKGGQEIARLNATKKDAIREVLRTAL